MPPKLPSLSGIKVDDLYVHVSHEQRDAWRCKSVKPEVTWARLAEGTQEPTEDGKMRTFVITGTGMPGWVVGPTIDRKYRHMTPVRVERLQNNAEGQAVSPSVKEDTKEKSKVQK